MCEAVKTPQFCVPSSISLRDFAQARIPLFIARCQLLITSFCLSNVLEQLYFIAVLYVSKALAVMIAPHLGQSAYCSSKF
jgi:hypothetical protein